MFGDVYISVLLMETQVCSEWFAQAVSTIKLQQKDKRKSRINYPIMISGGSTDVFIVFHNCRKKNVDSFCIFYAWNNANRSAFGWAFKHFHRASRLGSGVQLRGAWLLHSAYLPLVDNMTINGTAQAQRKFPNHMQGLQSEWCDCPFLRSRKDWHRSTRWGSPPVWNRPWGVNMSPLLEEAFSCFTKSLGWKCNSCGPTSG